LPGYGYARGGAESASQLAAIAEAYFRRPGATYAGSSGATPSSIRVALLLIDARHPGLGADMQAARWLDSMGVTRHIVATKIDKLTRSERARNLKALGDTFGTAALPVSATSGEGLDALWRMIVRIARDADKDG
jgi:GTP-binding protein